MKTAFHIPGGLTALAASFALAGLLAAGTAQARSNPVDPVSNPDKLNYSDVEMTIPDYDEPFQRNGIVSQPAVFKTIAPGLPAAQVQATLGQPLEQTQGEQGPEWNYNFTLLMPQSENYLVCQYKVVFDGNQQVKDTVWRRHQCLDIVNGAAQ